MNERILELARQVWPDPNTSHVNHKKFAELIVRECASICMEMATKCAGLEGDGALAKDCAYWIKEDFGVKHD